MATMKSPETGGTPAPQETSETPEATAARPDRIRLTGLLAKAPPLSAALTAVLLATPTFYEINRYMPPGHRGAA